jgi:FMN phosphatase YigB (HAD superfamily)
VIRAVFFDVGETIVDETRSWAAWADHLGVSHFTFFAAMGVVVERGWHHHKVFELIRPGFDLDLERPRFQAAGGAPAVEEQDLYPDALSCLRALREAGYRLGLAGNQPEAIEAMLARMDLPVDVIASSGRWGVEKPSAAFFARVVEAAGTPAAEIAYVGDRLDNDVLPARDAGMHAVFLRRGPWGMVHATRPEAALAHACIDSLEELPEAIAALSSAAVRGPQ